VERIADGPEYQPLSLSSGWRSATSSTPHRGHHPLDLIAGIIASTIVAAIAPNRTPLSATS
jgi:hypothetical protein